MGLMGRFSAGGPVGVDTAHSLSISSKSMPRFLPLVEPPFLEKSVRAAKELVTSALTLLPKSLVVSLPFPGDHLLAGRYEALLTQSRGVAPL